MKKNLSIYVSSCAPVLLEFQFELFQELDGCSEDWRILFPLQAPHPPGDVV